MEKEEKRFNKNILIAVDESENSRRAVSYVGQLLGGLGGFNVTVLHVIPKQEKDIFLNGQEEETWYQNYIGRIGNVLDEYRKVLIRWGFDPAKISLNSPLRYCPSMGGMHIGRKGQGRVWHHRCWETGFVSKRRVHFR